MLPCRSICGPQLHLSLEGTEGMCEPHPNQVAPPMLMLELDSLHVRGSGGGVMLLGVRTGIVCGYVFL